MAGLSNVYCDFIRGFARPGKYRLDDFAVVGRVRHGLDADEVRSWALAMLDAGDLTLHDDCTIGWARKQPAPAPDLNAVRRALRYVTNRPEHIPDDAVRWTLAEFRDLLAGNDA